MKNEVGQVLHMLSLRVGEALQKADAKSAHHALKDLFTLRRTAFSLTANPKRGQKHDSDLGEQLELATFILQQYELILEDFTDCMHWQGREYVSSREKMLNVNTLSLYAFRRYIKESLPQVRGIECCNIFE